MKLFQFHCLLLKTMGFAMLQAVEAPQRTGRIWQNVELDSPLLSHRCGMENRWTLWLKRSKALDGKPSLTGYRKQKAGEIFESTKQFFDESYAGTSQTGATWEDFWKLTTCFFCGWLCSCFFHWQKTPRTWPWSHFWGFLCQFFVMCLGLVITLKTSGGIASTKEVL